jgi:ribosomal protein L13E
MTLGQFEDRLRAVQDKEIKSLEAIAKASQTSFGIFTPLRILMVAQLPPEKARQVVSTVRTGRKIGVAELKHFGVDNAN